MQVARYLTPRMLETAAANGIELVQIDWNRSLLEQGPFHVIIHKLRPDAGDKVSIVAMQFPSASAHLSQ